MGNTHMPKLVIGLILIPIFIIVLLIFFFYYRRKSTTKNIQPDLESSNGHKEYGEEEIQIEDLITFNGGEDLTIGDILDAPGEVIGKSNYGTLYKAMLQRSSGMKLLRFLRPICSVRDKDFCDVIEVLGSIRHPNLVPLLGFYGGPRGEKLLVHPYYRRGNLAQFIRGENGESRRWTVIYNIAIGIAEGLDHLHT